MSTAGSLGLPSLDAQVRLAGVVDENMLRSFQDQLRAVSSDSEPLVFELSTSGGDADIGRRLALEIRLLQQQGKRDVYFLGKSFVYSAGVTFMAAFPVAHRFLTRDCTLLIHERKMDKRLRLSGPLRSCKAVLNDALAEVLNGEALQLDGFNELVEGTRVTLTQLQEKVSFSNWYVRADEAVSLGLVKAIV